MSKKLDKLADKLAQAQGKADELRHDYMLQCLKDAEKYVKQSGIQYGDTIEVFTDKDQYTCIYRGIDWKESWDGKYTLSESIHYMGPMLFGVLLDECNEPNNVCLLCPVDYIEKGKVLNKGSASGV